MAKNSANPNHRLLYLGIFVAFWFVVICGRLVLLQLVDYGDYTQKAARQQQRTIEISPVRGNVYDRNGNTLAMSVNVESIFAVPSEVSDIHGTSRILGRILGADAAEIENRMHSSRAFAWVARKVDNNLSSRVRSLNLKGIYFQKESKRFYPKRELAAQVLGWVGMNDDVLGGVERSERERLAGKPGKMLISMDAKRRWFGSVQKDPDPGENVVLTIDEKIQYIAERELDRGMAESHAQTGTVVVQNPHTGEILALASRPTFNPNLLNEADPKSLKDRAVSDIYEPGSTFKVITLAAALEEHLTNPDEVIDCQNGSIIVNGLRIHDHKAYKDLTVSQILEKSSDVGAIKLALRLGEERFDRYIRAFGFGTQTGIELPDETRGITRPVQRWSKVSIGAISMGQEVGVTPLQLVSMISSIANDGVYVAPRIIAGTTPPRSTQQLIAFHPVPGRRVISPMTAAQMKHIMEGVVLRGTGTRAALDGYSVAGKTGTSQKVDAVTHRYSHQLHVASFAGFAPVNNPAVTVLVVMDAPQGPQDGGLVAAPIFTRVAQQVLAYMNVPHDVDVRDPRRIQLRAKAKDEDMMEASPDYIAGQPENVTGPQPAMENVTSNAGQGSANQLAASVITAVSPAVTKPNTEIAKAVTLTPAAQPASLPPALSPIPASTKGTIVLDVAGGVLVPDFHGKTLRSALEVAESAGLELEVSGSGVGRDQTPPAGARIPPGGHVTVRFTR